MEKRIMEKFLKVNKKYLNSNLKPLEILILSQIEEFINNGRDCYITNKQFAEMFNAGTATVARAIDSLVESGYITRNTTIISTRGQASKMRKLSLANSVKKQFNWSF
jgi:DNA-binding MarR family transcriptional regulator